MRGVDGWPRDPRLDPFRDVVWQLSRRGAVVGYLACRAVPMRGSPQVWEKQEWLWYRVTWLDGRHERPGLDHGPGWTVLSGLEGGRLELDDLAGTVLDAAPVEAARRAELWRRYGPPS